MLEVLEMLGSAGGDAPCAALYARGRGGWVLFAGGAGGVEVPEVIRCVLTLYARGSGG